jgi:hypothetical protein
MKRRDRMGWVKESCFATLYSVFVFFLSRCALCSMGMTQSGTLHPPAAGGDDAMSADAGGSVRFYRLKVEVP